MGVVCLGIFPYLMFMRGHLNGCGLPGYISISNVHEGSSEWVWSAWVNFHI